MKNIIINGIEIKSLQDLNKLKPFMNDKKTKLNISKIARELGVDPRTVKKYIEGFEKKKTREKKSKLDDYYDTIVELLNTKGLKFYYKRNLYNYLKEIYGLDVPESTFRYYIKRHPELYNYFK